MDIRGGAPPQQIIICAVIFLQLVAVFKLWIGQYQRTFFQIHSRSLTQILTQVCAKACGRNGEIPTKFRIFLLQNRRIRRKKCLISRTDSSWQSWGQRFDPAYLHHVKSLEIMRFQGFFVVCPLPWNCTTPVIMESVWNPFGLSAQKSVLSSCSVYFRKAFSELFRLLSDFREKYFSWNF